MLEQHKDKLELFITIDEEYRSFFESMTSEEASIFINRILSMYSNQDVFTNLIKQISKLETELKVSIHSISQKIDNMKLSPTKINIDNSTDDEIDLSNFKIDTSQLQQEDIEFEDLMSIMEGEIL